MRALRAIMVGGFEDNAPQKHISDRRWPFGRLSSARISGFWL